MPAERGDTSPRNRINTIAFVTGTRAEFGLMRSTLTAIAAHRSLRLKLIATGMHLDRSRGYSVNSIRQEGWMVDKVVPWNSTESQTRRGLARCTGKAVAGIATALDHVDADVVLVVGDRVEAFAAATAGHLSRRIVAHVHGGDRAAGQVDDALRHAIAKLAHVHFPATAQSAKRLRQLGEDDWRIHLVGSPGIDGIVREAAALSAIRRAIAPLEAKRFALLVLHPVDDDAGTEYRRAKMIAAAVKSVPFPQIVVVHPNNDPGSAGIVRAWQALPVGGRFVVKTDVPRPIFLGLMRDAAVLAGNSSSGIIEAASFGTPTIDIGPRQLGRERAASVVNVPYRSSAIRYALDAIWNGGNPQRADGPNPYGGSGTGRKIAAVLSRIRRSPRLLRKLISY